MIKFNAAGAPEPSINPAVFSLLELCRSHAYISSTLFQELVSDLYDVKNPLMLQALWVNYSLDHLYNQSHLSADLFNWGTLVMRRNGLMPPGILEEEVYAALG